MHSKAPIASPTKSPTADDKAEEPVMKKTRHDIVSFRNDASRRALADVDKSSGQLMKVLCAAGIELKRAAGRQGADKHEEIFASLVERFELCLMLFARCPNVDEAGGNKYDHAEHAKVCGKEIDIGAHLTISAENSLGFVKEGDAPDESAAAPQMTEREWLHEKVSKLVGAIRLLPVDGKEKLKLVQCLFEVPAAIKKLETVEEIATAQQALSDDTVIIADLKRAVASATASLKKDTDTIQRREKVESDAAKTKAAESARVAGLEAAARLKQTLGPTPLAKAFTLDWTTTPCVKSCTTDGLAEFRMQNVDLPEPYLVTGITEFGVLTEKPIVEFLIKFHNSIMSNCRKGNMAKAPMEKEKHKSASVMPIFKAALPEKTDTVGSNVAENVWFYGYPGGYSQAALEIGAAGSMRIQFVFLLEGRRD